MGLKVEPLENKNSSRRNGLSNPRDIKQVAQWVAFLTIFLYCIFIVIPLLKSWPVSLAILLFVAFCFILAQWKATSIDPRDDNVTYEGEPEKFVKSDSNRHVIRNLYCQICKVAVEKQTKHCRSCNKCVHKFDHHCDWLNNCVGEKNYRWFFVTVLMAIVLCALVLSLCVTSLIGLWVSPHLLHEEPYLGKINEKKDAKIAITVCTSIVSFLLLVIIIFLAQLFSMHVYFIYKNMTTYEYIVQKRQKRAAKEKAQAEEAKRKEAESNQIKNGIGNAAFEENSDRIKSASTVITTADVAMKA